MFELRPMRRSYPDFPVFHDFDNLERSFFSGAVPFRTDIRTDGSNYILEAELPGFDKSDLKLDLDGTVLTISAEHTDHSEDKKEDGTYLRRERSFRSCSRSFDLEGVELDQIQATYANGLLTLTMPKKSETLPAVRHLEIM